MPDDQQLREQLREALLDMQVLQERDGEALQECRALFTVLDALSRAQSVGETCAALVCNTQAQLGADRVLLFEDGADSMSLLDPVPEEAVPRSLSRIPGLFDKPRNFAELGQSAGAPLADLSGEHVQSLVSAPVSRGAGQTIAIAAFRRDRGAFTSHDRRILTRIAELAEQAFRAQDRAARDRLMAAVIDQSPFGLTIADATDPEHRLIFANPAFENITGFRQRDVLGRSDSFVSCGPEPPDSGDRFLSRVGQSSVPAVDRQTCRRNGDRFWSELARFALRGHDGAPDYMVALQSDVTERLRAEEERETVRRRMDEALSHTRDALLLLSRQRLVLLSNPMMQALFPAPNTRWTPGTSFDNNWADHMATVPASLRGQPGMMSKLDLDALASQRAGKETRLPDGRVVLVRATRTSDGGMVVSGTDITPIKSAENMLRQRMAAIDSAADGIGTTDGEGRLVQINPSLNALLGAKSETALIGRPWWRVYEDDNGQDMLRNLERELKRTGKVSAQLSCSSAEAGRVHHVALSVAQDVGRILIVRDVTAEMDEQRRRRELADQLDLARRQQVLSDIAARLAHDFNNLLSAITGSADLIEADKTDPVQVSRHAARIAAAGGQAAELVKRLMDVGRGQRAMTRFDLRKAVSDSVELARTSLRDTTTLWTDFARQTMAVKGSVTEVGQIVVNLILNAEDALQGRTGEIVVSLMVRPGTGHATVMAGDLHADRTYAVLSVRDSGSGILPEMKARIFEPYFTTKGDKGTGLGLPSIAQIVTRLGGALTLETSPEKGSTFRIYWPLAAPEEIADNRKVAGIRVVPENAARLEGALILLVGTEARVTGSLGAYLERLGAEVACVDAADLAIDAVREDPGAWAAVIAECAMGAATGGNVAGAVASMAPELPVFVIAGGDGAPDGPQISGKNVRGVFAKPVDLRRVAVAISQAIAGPTPDAKEILS